VPLTSAGRRLDPGRYVVTLRASPQADSCVHFRPEGRQRSVEWPLEALEPGEAGTHSALRPREPTPTQVLVSLAFGQGVARLLCRVELTMG